MTKVAPATAKHLITLMKQHADPDRASSSLRFFKTGKGEYGEGNQFIGLSMPVLRKLARAHQDMSLDEVEQVLESAIHEARVLALLIMVARFQAGKEPEAVYQLYLRCTDRINIWDLVDCSAHLIVGPWLWRRNKDILVDLARSASLWERRIAILATLHFIRQHQFKVTLNIARLLLQDTEDLIHKAVGWMLREVGNRDIVVEEQFLSRHYRDMPRTILRYSIEKFPQSRRKAYLTGKV
jgi:3-methyladenine DNA glycosylase AlkD